MASRTIHLAILEYDRRDRRDIAGRLSIRTALRYRFLEILGTNGSARAQPYTYPVAPDGGSRRGGRPVQGRATDARTAPAARVLAYTPDFREMAAIIRNGAQPAYSPEHDLVTHETLLRVCGMLEFVKKES